MTETPTLVDRDRVVDLLRIGSLIVVVAGHSIMLTVDSGPGGITLGNVLADVPALQAFTWLLQVLPLFFFAGAAAATFGWSSWRTTTRTSGQWLLGRAQRLLRPVAWYVSAVIAVLLVLRLRGATALADVVARLGVQLLWFVGAYLLVLAVVPTMQRISTARHVAWTLAACIASTAIIDAVRLTLGPDTLGYLNFLTVWTVPAVLGVAYTKRLLAPRAAVVLAAVAFGIDVALVALGPYEPSLVTVPGQHLSNMSPPSLLLAGHAITLCALAIALRGPIAALVSRPRIWWWTMAGNRAAMTLYLWHLPVLAVIIGGGELLGVTRSDPHTVMYPVVVATQTMVLILAMIPVVAVLAPLENRPLPWWDDPLAPAAHRLRDTIVLTALLVTAAATLSVARYGLLGPGRYWLAIAVAGAVLARLPAARRFGPVD
ncbi:acyltransferase family protein [Gordonia rhizosphera]|uniref:Acyltransferase 3 domain-containing protein n=1 Tax=Gordonia rhizosphera NBRC 16068 TaxID=1108045 RepID=K6WE42_9ACTN|nr:acyltransferase family protein [Gordonia rhizosphera]GAB90457.1 hypothetical protein GORHZ_103_00100 [Gordonia rhizosphera NBRC 16068]